MRDLRDVYPVVFDMRGVARREPKSQRERLACELIRARVNVWLSREEVAAHLSVSARTIEAWEQGRYVPDVLVLARLAALYGVSLDKLLVV